MAHVGEGLRRGRVATALPLRIEFPGAYYRLMYRGLAYQPVFNEDADRQMFFR